MQIEADWYKLGLLEHARNSLEDKEGPAFRYLTQLIDGMRKELQAQAAAERAAKSVVVEGIQGDHEETSRSMGQPGILHSRAFTWQPDMASTITVHSGKYPTPEDADRDCREQALALGYQPPRWWQFWRRGEYPLPLPKLQAGCQ